MKITDVNLDVVYSNTVPANKEKRILQMPHYFLASFISFLTQTNNIGYVKKYYEDLNVWFLSKTEYELTGTNEVEIEMNDHEYEQWSLVENYKLEDYLNYLRKRST